MVLPDREEELIPAQVAAELREEEEDQNDPGEDLRSNTTVVTTASARNLDANSSTSSAASPAPSSSSPSPNLTTLQFLNTCECCTERPADWWCPADQAYFCHTCDQSVHSANAFSSRHERERISPEPCRARDPGYESDPEEPVSVSANASKRKSGPNSKSSDSPRKMIKAEELAEDDTNPEEVEEDVFQDIDLFLAEDEVRNNTTSTAITTTNTNSSNNLNTTTTNSNNNSSSGEEDEQQEQQEQQGDELIVPRMSDTCENLNELLGLSGFEPQEEDDESRFDFAIRKNNVVRLIDGPDEVDGFYTRAVKLEEDHHLHHHHHHQAYVKPQPKLEDELSYRAEQHSVESLQFQIPLLKKSLLENPKKPWLKLDMKDVQNCWQSGLFLQDVKDAKPLLPGESISDAAGSSDVGVVPDMSRSRKSGNCEEQAGQVPVHMSGDLDSPGGREARVSRYREKRRTRLFSKKIRYEVRKLNAERRPRLKGRFVKRSPVGGS